MGRIIINSPKPAIPAGFLQELNNDLLEDLWFALAAAKHPETFDECDATLEDVFEHHLADVTWEDFWKAFPFELREQGHCLDEVDALGLLLSTRISRSRFERHFEQLASSSSGSSSHQQASRPNAGFSSSGVNRASSFGMMARAFSGAAGLHPDAPRSDADADRMDPADRDFIELMLNSGPAFAFDGLPPVQPQRATRRRPSQRQPVPAPPSAAQQQQQQQQSVAYVSPVAPGRMLAPTHSAGASPVHLDSMDAAGAHQNLLAQAEAAAGEAAAAAAAGGSRMLAAGSVAGALGSSIAVPSPASADAVDTEVGLAASLQNRARRGGATRQSTASLAPMLGAAAAEPVDPPVQAAATAAGRPAAAAHARQQQQQQPWPAGGDMPSGSQEDEEYEDGSDQEEGSGMGIEEVAAHINRILARGRARSPRTATTAALGAARSGEAAAAAYAAGRAAAAARLSGHRRSWLEACDPDGYEQQQQGQQLQLGAGDQQQQQEAGASAAADADGVTAATAAAGRCVDYRPVWRAVHEWLTGEDEDLLVLVSQVVPYSLAGMSLRDQASTEEQLRVLANSRPVPQQVISTTADRLHQPCPSGEAHLVRLTASSGFSRRAAAAAAALECCEHHGVVPFYINLAGLCTEDDVEAAIMRGLFSTEARSARTQRAAAQAEAAAEPAAAPPAPAAAGPEPAAAAAAAAPPAAAGEAAGAAETAEAAAAALHARRSMLVALRDAYVAARPAQATTDVEPLLNQMLAQMDEASAQQPDPQLLSQDPAPGPAAAAGSPFGLTPSRRARSVGTSGSLGSSEEDTDRLSAHLILLGRCCSKQPLLLLLDEVDAAMTPDDGRPLRDVLMQLLYHLPQAVVVITSSSGLDAWRDAAVLRQVGEPLVQQLYDGQLVLVEHRLPRLQMNPHCSLHL